MNIELTTNCALHCPECYCSLSDNKNIDINKAVYWLKQAGEMGVTSVFLSGGETLLYPNLYEIVNAAAIYCENVYIAISGYGFTEYIFDRLIISGISGIFVSLNGSTEEINSTTRNGFDVAISALNLLKEKNYSETWLNWVMYSSNVDDFNNILNLAEKFDVKNFVIMAQKPNSSNELNYIPSGEQMIALAKTIKNYKGDVQIMVETCFSPMLALVYDDKLYGNKNTGKDMGCGAGISCFSLNVDSMLSPCRHLDFFEDYVTLSDYWNNSPILNMLRTADSRKRQPCRSCRYSLHCRHCIAINSKLKGDIFLGNDYCDLYHI
jgi:pyrroloquinoline quinone biosynthesis protein E